MEEEDGEKGRDADVREVKVVEGMSNGVEGVGADVDTRHEEHMHPEEEGEGQAAPRLEKVEDGRKPPVSGKHILKEHAISLCQLPLRGYEP